MLSNPYLVILKLPVAKFGPLKEVIRRLRQLPLNILIVPGEIAMEQTPSIQLSQRELPGVQLIMIGICRLRERGSL